MDRRRAQSATSAGAQAAAIALAVFALTFFVALYYIN
jgi:hypothetical protein